MYTLDWHSLDPQRDLSYILLESKEHPVPAVLLNETKVFTQESANLLWNSVVTKRWRQRFCFVRHHPWLFGTSALGPYWIDSWNQWIQSLADKQDSVKHFLQENVPWQPEQRAIVIYSGKAACSIEWNAFVNYWQYVLIADETLLIVAPGRTEFIRFEESGRVAVGKRDAISILDDGVLAFRDVAPER